MLMKTLTDLGFAVTTGVLNTADTDFATAEYLKIPVVTEAPFSPITEKSQKANLAMVTRASIVVITSVPFGLGNMQNLEAAKQAAKQGTPTYILNDVPLEMRDFTGGKATAAFEELELLGAKFVRDQAELLRSLDICGENVPNVSGLAAEHLKLDDKLGKNHVSIKR